MLRAGDGEDVAADMPGLQSFDHAVVYVPGKPALWIDVTEAHAVVGQTAEALQGRSALIVDAGAKALTRIPSSASSENHYVEERDFALAADGPAHVVETSEATGLLRARLVSSYADLPIDKAREQLARYARALYAAPKLDEVNLQLDDKRSPARVRLEMSGAARGLTDSAKAEVLLDPSVVFAWLPSFLRDSDDDDLAGGAKKTPRREHDVQLPLAYSAELRIRIAAPRGFAARALPASSTVRAGSAVISRTFTLDRRGPVEDAAASAPDVIATFRFDSGKERLNPQEAQALRRAIVAFREDTPASIVLDHEGALRFAEGKVKDALAIYEALIRAEPAMPIHAERLSAKLIELGLGDAARRATQRAVDAAPMRAAAWNALGWALMHDELGRPLHRGYDRAGALAAFARATTLDASDATARSNIAVLREHAADGTRYGAGSELDEAIGIYRKMKRDLKTNDVDDALLIALFYAGRYPEVRTEASAMPPSASRDLLLIEATAATQGGEAAVREAAKLIPDSRRRRDVLRSVLGDLVKLRRYEDAATIGVSGGVPGDADRLRKLKRAEDVPVPTDARGAVRRLLVAAFDETKTVAQASTGLVAARPMRAGTVRSTSTAMAALRTASRASVEQGLSRLFLLDATVAITESSVEGDDKTGYRVEVRTEAAGGVARESWYVVREDGRYVVLTAGADASELAAEALKNLDAGRVDVARAWLERARDAADARDDVEPRRGARGDPLIETLFDKLADKLPSKLPSKLDTASVDELRVVAASAAVLGPFAPNAEHVLDVARARAPDALRPAFATALTRAAIVAGDGKRATLQARELVAAHPLSLTAHRLLRSACRLTADVVCVQEDAATSLGAGVDDGEALEIVADARARAGDFSGAADLLRKVTGRRDAPPTAVNLQGWLALFTPTDVPRAATQVERAAMAAAKSGRGASSSLLHTLAALQAESGRAADALETLGKSIDDDTEATGGDGALRELDWYVVGRVAEGLGLDDDARAAYGRLHASEHENAVSTWQLAARRLRNLSAGAASSPPTDAASR